MAPGCKPGGLTPYVGSNPTPCIILEGTGASGAGLGEAGFVKVGGRSAMVAHQPSKLVVAGSNPVARSRVGRRSVGGMSPHSSVGRARPW